MSALRPPVLNGSWYPADARQLAASIDRWLAGADLDQKPAGRPWLAVAPHAGHVYSGPVCGKLFGLLQNERFDRIFLLAPNHRQAISDIVLAGHEAFSTPLGPVPLDQTTVDHLSRRPGFQKDDGPHQQEHAVEILLPFIQRTWPQKLPQLVPMLVPMQNETLLKEAAAELRTFLGQRDLLLVSSDFTHYGPSFGYVPFSEDVPMSLERLDAGALLKILGGDAAGLLQYGRETGITMCGLAACCVALGEGPPEGYEAALLDYSRSADADGDYSHSVSYAAVLISQGGSAP